MEFAKNNPGDENKTKRNEFTTNTTNQAFQKKLELPEFSFAGNEIEKDKKEKF